MRSHHCPNCFLPPQAEINNGRLAMLGIFAFLSESKIPGSVPALAGKIPAYAGDYMAPFESNFHTYLQSTLGSSM